MLYLPAPRLPAQSSRTAPPRRHGAASSPPALRRPLLASASSRHVCPDGVSLEVLHCAAASGSPARSPLLFVHGSYHAAWCWSEHWLPFFAARGFDAYACSLRAQGGSGGGRDGVAGTLATHAADVAHFAASLPAPPVVVGHSFGGLVVQELLGRPTPSTPRFAAAALLCSVPPAGNSAMASRMLKATPLKALRLTWAFIGRGFTTDAQLCRDTFFSKTLPQETLLKHMASIAGSGTTRLLDLAKLSASLPVPAQAQPGVPVLVVGALDDIVVDVEGVRETAAVWGVQPLLLPGLAHDVMLDTEWESAAEALGGWLDQHSL